MVRELDIINPLDDPAWDDRVRSTPNYSFFHSASWARVLHESYGYRPLYFTLIAGGKIQASVPCMEIESILTGKRAVSLPFTDYCDPIAAPDFSGERLQLLLKQLLAYGKKAAWKSVELRSGVFQSGEFPSSRVYYGHTLDLTRKEEEILSAFRDSTQRNINKAVKAGVQVGIFRSPDSVGEFYRLHCLTRKEHGLPPQPYRFFEKVHEHLLSRDKGFIVLASIGDTYIAGAVFFHFGEKAIYKYGASDRNFQHLRANNLVIWEAIQWCSRNGYKALCFGRTEPDNEGLLQFKRGWAAEERPLPYYRYDFGNEAFIGEISHRPGVRNRIFHNMPIPLLRMTGSLLYRHMG